jgi:hypothetical protein
MDGCRRKRGKKKKTLCPFFPVFCPDTQSIKKERRKRTVNDEARELPSQNAIAEIRQRLRHLSIQTIFFFSS